MTGELTVGIARAEVIIVVTQIRNDGGPYLSSSSGGCKKQSDFTCVLKAEVTGFDDGSEVRI